MMGHPGYLADFLNCLADGQAHADVTSELVINGDFIDFLAEPDYEAWTSDEEEALRKLKNTFEHFGEVFDALAACVGRGMLLTIMLGNHDVEMALPRVRRALFERLGVGPHNCLFVADNEAYSAGDVLIEHGNRYDSWNAIDHDGLRQIVSSYSRGEEPLQPMDVCPGSKFVEQVMNPLKETYHFIDLLKPETKIVSLLLTALEPSLRYDLKAIYKAASVYTERIIRSKTWKEGGQPSRSRLISAGQQRLLEAKRNVMFGLPDDVKSAFPELEGVRMEGHDVGALSGLRRLFLVDRSASAGERLRRGERLEREQLRKISVALAHALQGDRTFELGQPDGPYLDAARRMIEGGVAKLVVMGHTHLAREVDVLPGGKYVNTGTWADLLRVPGECLADTDDALEALQEWLKALVTNDLKGRRYADPAYADILLDDDGRVLNGGETVLKRFLAQA
jgi:UDP-2,3-diacylglucosamine pyrophosphatase LpxH